MKKLKNEQELKEQAHKLRQFLKRIKETNLDPNRGPVCKDPNFGASLYPPYPVDPWDMPGDRG
jgi:hypothetical protein